MAGVNQRIDQHFVFNSKLQIDGAKGVLPLRQGTRAGNDRGDDVIAHYPRRRILAQRNTQFIRTNFQALRDEQ